MAANATKHDTAGAANPVASQTQLLVEAARALLPRIEATAPELERTGVLPPDLLAEMHTARLFRMLLPRSLDGLEIALPTFIQVVETLATADASTAWLVAQGCGCTSAAIYTAPDVGREIFGPHDAILAWGPGGSGARAVPVEGGYRVTGTWHFASGNRNAQWLGGHCLLYGADGKLLPGPDGPHIDRTMLFPRSAAKVLDTWDVIGLAGTGSDSYTVEDLFVPAARSFTRESAAERRETGPLYRFTAMNVFAFGVAAISLGIARAMLTAFIELAQDKTERATGTALKLSGVIQSEVGRSETRLLSSRMFLLETVREAHATAAAGEPFTIDQRRRMRGAAIWASTQARAVADFTYHAAGTAAVFSKGPFERRFRDINTVSQQVQAHASNFELVGQSLLGVPVTSRLL